MTDGFESRRSLLMESVLSISRGGFHPDREQVVTVLERIAKRHRYPKMMTGTAEVNFPRRHSTPVHASMDSSWIPSD